MADDKIPFKNKELADYGVMKLNSRDYDGVLFPIWNAIQNCEGTRCVAATACTYSMSGHVKCKVILKYLIQLEHMIYANFSQDLEQHDLYRIGMHLVPLYKQLARLKIYEMSMTTRAMAEETRSGTTKMHSIFKEIRECIRSIDSAWREIGIGKAKRFEDPSVPMKPAIDYYERMEKEAAKEGQGLKLVKRNG